MNAQTKIEAAASVYAKIAAVQGELAAIGIGKDSENSSQNYKFRGIDAVYNTLSPLLARHGLCILPRMVSREREERVTVKTWNGQAKESVTFYVSVEAEFDFVSADDGSRHTIRTFGEAMDNGDKATNKAMSAAYKYAAFMAFAIPTEGDNDADASTHEVVPKGQERSGVNREVSPAPQTVSQDDLTMIIQLCEAVGDNQVAAILKACSISALPELPANKVAAVVKRLNEKLAAKAKSDTNAKAGFGEVLADEIPY